MPNTLHSSLALLVISESFAIPGGMETNEADYLRTFILTAQKTGFMPALALTLHLLSEVDGFLAAAALVSSSKRHSVSMQESPLCTFFILCIYNISLVENQCYSADGGPLHHVRLDAIQYL